MRILPIALRFRHEPPDRLLELASRASGITHRHPRSQVACGVYCLVAAGLLRGQSVQAAHQLAVQTVSPIFKSKPLAGERHYFDAALAPDLATLAEQRIGSSGHVVDTLTASLWCLLSTGGYSEAVLKAVNLGGDTDTTGIAAGGLAGICYGIQAVPERWRTETTRAKDLESLFERFTGLCVAE